MRTGTHLAQRRSCALANSRHRLTPILPLRTLCKPTRAHARACCARVLRSRPKPLLATCIIPAQSLRRARLDYAEQARICCGPRRAVLSRMAQRFPRLLPSPMAVAAIFRSLTDRWRLALGPPPRACATAGARDPARTLEPLCAAHDPGRTPRLPLRTPHHGADLPPPRHGRPVRWRAPLEGEPALRV